MAITAEDGAGTGSALCLYACRLSRVGTLQVLRKVSVGFAHTNHGFVALILGFEISYAHFEDHLGIAWTRSIVLGKRRWWLREDWSVFAKSPPFRIVGR